MTVAEAPPIAHPRIQERRDAVEDEVVRKRHRRLVVAGVLVALALLAALSTRTPLLDVDEVRVIGATTLSPDALRAVSGIEEGMPLVGLDLDAAQVRLAAIPHVAVASVERSWGGVVTLRVDERIRAARIATAEGVLIVASDGLVLEVTEEPDASLTAITGAMFSTPAGAYVPAELNDAVTLAASLPSDIGRVVDRIVVGQDRLALAITGGGMVEIGDARDLDAKFDSLRALFGQVQLACLDRIDVRAATVPIVARGGAC